MSGLDRRVTGIFGALIGFVLGPFLAYYGFGWDIEPEGDGLLLLLAVVGAWGGAAVTIYAGERSNRRRALENEARDREGARPPASRPPDHRS